MNDTDRDRIADIIAEAIWGCDYTCRDHGERALIAADRIATKFGDRLLPELPEGWSFSGVVAHLNDPGFFAMLVKDGDDEHNPHEATGPTIPAAIRNALETQP